MADSASGLEGVSAAEAVTSGGSPIGSGYGAGLGAGSGCLGAAAGLSGLLEVLVGCGLAGARQATRRAAGLPAEAAKVGGLRSKLKRLVTVLAI
jgi:hypothetical protein